MTNFLIIAVGLELMAIALAITQVKDELEESNKIKREELEILKSKK